MNVLRQPVPWDYHDVVLGYLRSSDVVLDVGTGAGERLRGMAPSFGHGLGIDADPEMVRLASQNPGAGNLSFRVCSERLESVPPAFDVILDMASAAILNRLLAGNVDNRGFVTNEHRYLAIAQCVRGR
jgi:hypothetical protein